MTTRNTVRMLPEPCIDANCRGIMAPCKVNWFLEIERKREDGFHEITTEMETINWCDEIIAAERNDGKLEFSACGDAALVAAAGDPSQNLVLRAARVLRDRLLEDGSMDASKGATIWLDKRVPVGAGLGGGSSDAVATMRLLTELWGVDVPDEMLAELAAGIGSDTVFFVHGGRAVCTGRGEIVRPLGSSSERHLVVVWPGIPVSTPAVYKSGMIDLGSRRRVWEDHVEYAGPGFNRLEEACIQLEPRVGGALSRAQAKLAMAFPHPSVMLSGSGSAFVARADTEQIAHTVAEMLANAFPAPSIVRACKTLPARANMPFAIKLR